jgi:hypothetical protein
MTGIPEQANEPGEHTPPAALPTKRIGRVEYIVSGIAAVLLVAIISWMSQPTVPPRWGFNRPEALTQQMPADEYLKHLAKASNEWFDKRPQTKAEFALRLKQYINGCQTLIDADHAQLAQEDRDWLRESCIVWKANLEGQLGKLNSGSQTVEAVREESDATIKQLQEALRTRAEQTSN